MANQIRVRIEHEGIKKETAAAMMLVIEVSLNDGEPRGATMWLPKSQIDNFTERTVEIPLWLFDSKVADLRERFGGNDVFLGAVGTGEFEGQALIT
jgi:hypothetical protein